MDDKNPDIPQGEDECMKKQIEDPAHGDAAKVAGTSVEDPSDTSVKVATQPVMDKPQLTATSMPVPEDCIEIEISKAREAARLSRDAITLAQESIQVLELVVDPAASAVSSTPAENFASVKQAVMNVIESLEISMGTNKQIIEMYKRLYKVLGRDYREDPTFFVEIYLPIPPRRPPPSLPDRPVTEPAVDTAEPETTSGTAVSPSQHAADKDQAASSELVLNLTKIYDTLIKDYEDLKVQFSVCKARHAAKRSHLADNLCNIARQVLKDSLNKLAQYDEDAANIQKVCGVDTAQGPLTSVKNIAGTTSADVTAEPTTYPAPKRLKLDSSQSPVDSPSSASSMYTMYLTRFRFATKKAIGIIKHAVETNKEACWLFEEVIKMLRPCLSSDPDPVSHLALCPVEPGEPAMGPSNIEQILTHWVKQLIENFKPLQSSAASECVTDPFWPPPATLYTRVLVDLKDHIMLKAWREVAVQLSLDAAELTRLSQQALKLYIEDVGRPSILSESVENFGFIKYAAMIAQENIELSVKKNKQIVDIYEILGALFVNDGSEPAASAVPPAASAVPPAASAVDPTEQYNTIMRRQLGLRHIAYEHMQGAFLSYQAANTSTVARIGLQLFLNNFNQCGAYAISKPAVPDVDSTQRPSTSAGNISFPTYKDTRNLFSIAYYYPKMLKMGPSRPPMDPPPPYGPYTYKMALDLFKIATNEAIDAYHSVVGLNHMSGQKFESFGKTLGFGRFSNPFMYDVKPGKRVMGLDEIVANLTRCIGQIIETVEKFHAASVMPSNPSEAEDPKE